MKHAVPLLPSFLLLIGAGCADVSARPAMIPVQPSVETAPFVQGVSGADYREYLFDSGEDRDLGFTERALARLREKGPLLDGGSAAIEDGVMKYADMPMLARNRGVIESRTWKDDVYELTQPSPRPDVYGPYRVTKNGEKLFEKWMYYGAAGPIMDWRVVDGKPAFTYSSDNCVTDEERNRISCSSDIWYDGALMSERFDAENPRYLFAHAGKVGFVASDAGQDKIFYDGKFITPGFDWIWTHNCCSMTEILPTVHENGVLLFHALRGDKTFLAEVRLK